MPRAVELRLPGTPDEVAWLAGVVQRAVDGFAQIEATSQSDVAGPGWMTEPPTGLDVLWRRDEISASFRPHIRGLDALGRVLGEAWVWWMIGLPAVGLPGALVVAATDSAFLGQVLSIWLATALPLMAIAYTLSRTADLFSQIEMVCTPNRVIVRYTIAGWRWRTDEYALTDVVSSRAWHGKAAGVDLLGPVGSTGLFAELVLDRGKARPVVARFRFSGNTKAEAVWLADLIQHAIKGFSEFERKDRGSPRDRSAVRALLKETER